VPYNSPTFARQIEPLAIRGRTSPTGRLAVRATQFRAPRGHQPEHGTFCLAASFSTLRSIESSMPTGADPCRPLLSLPPLGGNRSAIALWANGAVSRTRVRTFPYC